MMEVVLYNTVIGEMVSRTLPMAEVEPFLKLVRKYGFEDSELTLYKVDSIHLETEDRIVVYMEANEEE